MARVVFVSQEGEEVAVMLPDGGALVDAADTHAPFLPFSCRSASCGTCRIRVLDGGSMLTDPEDEELDVLDAFGSKPDKFRLACQAKARPGDGTVKVRPARDDE